MYIILYIKYIKSFYLLSFTILPFKSLKKAVPFSHKISIIAVRFISPRLRD